MQDIFREYCLAFCLALRPADIARGFQAQAPRPVEPVPLGALISASVVGFRLGSRCKGSTALHRGLAPNKFQGPGQAQEPASVLSHAFSG